MAAYAAYRGWAFLEAVVEASRRPVTVRRNLQETPERGTPARAPSRKRAPTAEREAPEREAPEREFRRRGDAGQPQIALAEPFRSR